MTQEEKQLLLKDLCARVPYNVFVNCTEEDDERTNFNCIFTPEMVKDIQSETAYWVVKPYLRPMSSMTEEEKLKYITLTHYNTDDEGNPYRELTVEALDWLNENHIDYRGLIEKGLAIEAPEWMYNKEEPENGSEVPVPKTVDEAISTLEKILSDEDREYLLKNGAISMHDSLGRWIRNEWGLWTGSDLKNELKKKGFEHPDDMSNYIIEEFIKYWNNKL